MLGTVHATIRGSILSLCSVVSAVELTDSVSGTNGTHYS